MKSEVSDVYRTGSAYQWHKKLFWKKQKRKKKLKKNPGRNRKKGEKKRSSTLAFLEVAWGIAKEIPSDITRFYDRELPYETVRAWCSPV